MGPGGCAVAHGFHIGWRDDGHRIVIAFQGPSAFRNELPGALHHSHRVCAVTHKVTQQCNLGASVLAGVRQAGVKGLNVGVNI